MNMPVTLEKARLNIWNMAGFAAVIAATSFGWGITYSTMTAADIKAVESIADVQSEIKDIQGQLPAIVQLQFQQTRSTELSSENRKSVEEVNRRLDRVVESFGGKLDTVIERLNSVATSVEVLSTRINRQEQIK